MAGSTISFLVKNVPYHRQRAVRTKMKRSCEFGKKVALFYFELISEEEDRYQCKLCPKVQRVQKQNTGFSNLMSHITSAHPNFEEEMKKTKDGKIVGIKISTPCSDFKLINTRDFLVPPKINNIYSWVDWIVNEGLPFSTVEKSLTRKYTNLSPISISSLMNAMKELTVVVEKKITEILPNQFALVFDGWSLDGTSNHYVGIFATFSTFKGSDYYFHSYNYNY